MNLAIIISFVSLWGCSAPAESVAQSTISPAEAKRVLVVMNEASSVSREICEYYMVKRKIPQSNLVRVNMSTSENVSLDEYRFQLEEPVKKKIASLGHQVDFILLTKGIPIRLRNNEGYSVDGHLATMNLNLQPIEKPEESQVRRCLNPYFNQDEPFSSKKYGFYLVTRLDGYHVIDIRQMINNSISARASKGPFLMDGAPERNKDGYAVMSKTLSDATLNLKSSGFEVVFDESQQFVGLPRPLAGYCSWGSNDAHFDVQTYRNLKFQPGAIAETFVSTSGRTFYPTTGGQSLIADLIAAGVTGVKGYVSEPFTFALAQPQILFNRYTKGHNLAESFYMASLVLKWKDVVIGDPLCRPYSKQ